MIKVRFVQVGSNLSYIRLPRFSCLGAGFLHGKASLLAFHLCFCLLVAKKYPLPVRSPSTKSCLSFVDALWTSADISAYKHLNVWSVI